MIDTKEFIESLTSIVDFYTGVPDSLLKDFCACINDCIPKEKHLIAANEGNAVGLAAGHYLATGKASLVYMQNSGIGNAINPLISLMDEDVYKIPALFLIGWRGEPGVKDEPQHLKQGKVTIPLLECLGVPSIVLDQNSNFEEVLNEAKKSLIQEKPFAIVVRKNTFSAYNSEASYEDLSSFTREEAVGIVLQESESSDFFVSTTGKISRELFELREINGQSHTRDFLTVGSMGHTSQIALGIAMAKPEVKVVCLDGDGSLLMHMGSLAVNGSLKTPNLIHVVLNNGSHDTVGGQPTCASKIDLCGMAKASGYSTVFSCSDKEGLKEAFEKVRNIKHLSFIEIKVKKGARNELGRPTESPVNCKRAFMQEISE